MERKVKKLEHCETEVIVSFTKEEWEASRNKAFKALAKDITVAGFRKGNAPEKLVREKIDPSKLMDKAVNNLLPDAYKAILDEDKVEPYAQPNISIEKVTDDELVVKFVITTRPEVTLGNYKGIAIGKDHKAIEDKDVDEAIDILRGQHASLVTKEGESKKGDTVVIDFLGKVDGKAFEGGAAQNYELALGSNSFIPGFEDQCIGHKAGEEFVVNVKFPEQYTKELAGKDATFEIKLHEVKEKKLPELDDNFVKELNLPKVNTVADLKGYKKQELTQNSEREFRNQYLDKLYDAVAKEAKIEIAPAVIEDEKQNRIKNITNQLSQQSGITLEQYFSFTGTTKEKFEKEIEAIAQKSVRNEAILNAIAEKEGIVITDADLEFEYAKIADQYGMKPEDVKKTIAQNIERFRYSVKFNRAEDLLFNSNK